jgi:hypothetical protein
MTEIIDNPAQSITAPTDETFAQYVDRIGRARRMVQYKNGKPIELDPNLDYSFLMLGFKKDPQTGTGIATPEQFKALVAAIKRNVDEMEAAGLLPEDWVQVVATPFDVIPPQVPGKFVEEAEERGLIIKTLLVGNIGFAIARMPPEVVKEEVVVDDNEE